jgi:hypothetical protein
VIIYDLNQWLRTFYLKFFINTKKTIKLKRSCITHRNRKVKSWRKRISKIS